MAFPYVPFTWVDGTPNQASAARLNAIEAGIALAGVTGTASTPPASPVDGMLWRLPAASGSGIYWLFQYDSSQATYKWVFIGGPPMSHEILTDETTSSTTYVDLTTVGPTLTLPRGGDYKTEFGAQMYNATGSNAAVAAIKRGAAATSDNDSIFIQNPTANLVLPGSRSLIITGMAASDVVKVQYKSSAATAAHALRRYMMITPIRII